MTDKSTRETATDELKTKSIALAKAEADLREAKADNLGLTMKTSSNTSVDKIVANGGYIESQITDLKAKIKTYDDIINAWYTTGPGFQEARGDGLLEATATQAGLPSALPDPEKCLGLAKQLQDVHHILHYGVRRRGFCVVRYVRCFRWPRTLGRAYERHVRACELRRRYFF